MADRATDGTALLRASAHEPLLLMHLSLLRAQQSAAAVPRSNLTGHACASEWRSLPCRRLRAPLASAGGRRAILLIASADIIAIPTSFALRIAMQNADLFCCQHAHHLIKRLAPRSLPLAPRCAVACGGAQNRHRGDWHRAGITLCVFAARAFLGNLIERAHGRAVSPPPPSAPLPLLPPFSPARLGRAHSASP